MDYTQHGHFGSLIMYTVCDGCSALAFIHMLFAFLVPL